MNPFKKNDASLSKKLKGALTDLTVDIFGYEKMVTKNITNRTNYISHRLQIPNELSSFVGRNFSEQNHLINYDKKSLRHRI